MKNNKTIILFTLLCSILIVACDNRTEAERVAEMEAITNPKQPLEQEEDLLVEKEVKLGDNKLIYLSKNIFILDLATSAEIKAVSPEITDASFYYLNIPESYGYIGLSYQKLKINPSMDGAVNGLINGYKKIDGVVVSDVKIEDVSSKEGFPSKSGHGKISINTTEGGISKGEFYFLAIQKDKELLLFQGLFETVDSEYAKDFLSMLDKVKLVRK